MQKAQPCLGSSSSTPASRASTDLDNLMSTDVEGGDIDKDIDVIDLILQFFKFMLLDVFLKFTFEGVAFLGRDVDLLDLAFDLFMSHFFV
jgi:hypothetical protein